MIRKAPARYDGRFAGYNRLVQTRDWDNVKQEFYSENGTNSGDFMAENIRLLVYPAKDLDASKAFFTTFLGVEPYVDGTYYVGYKAGELEIGLDPNGQAVIAYIDVEDINESLQTFRDAGASVVQDAKDVGGGLMIAQIKDANGNVLGLRQQSK
jgi:predicted enzyme related to lactoylglutathione lyase